MSNLYVTSFCNFAHSTEDGVPLNHECYIIPVMFLKAEQKGLDWPEPDRTKWSFRRKLHRGRKTR